MYSGPKLIELLAKQQETRGQSDLFKKGTFTIQWRAKVGSFPHPDVETIVSAGEPCGAWKPENGCPGHLSRPEAKRNVGDNWQYFRTLPLNGYIPGSAIRGLVRSWAKKHPQIRPRMLQLLGYQEDDRIGAGKIQFLDAWPSEATKLTLDIVNPQQQFQVFHNGQGTPLSLYTFGDGEKAITVTAAIRGITGKATPAEVAEVWGWVEQALSLYGVGSRTASGYGAVKPQTAIDIQPDPGCETKEFDFSLYSQGCAGPNIGTSELRPSHWRGWLRSWVLRFLLGVMSQTDAETTLGELLGILGRQGCVRLEMMKGTTWGKESGNNPRFYAWKGKVAVTAPTEILNEIILPIIRFAVMVGGVGRGWRRPLHIFQNDKGFSAARGSNITLRHSVDGQLKLFGPAPKPATWQKAYQDWTEAVRKNWPQRFNPGQNPQAEVFSPTSCAVYIVPKPVAEPLDIPGIEWAITQPTNTRGEGVNLIYQPKYKRQTDVGGNAAGGGGSNCSWVSIKRVKIPHQQAATDCQEIVCLFMGGSTPNNAPLRTDFLRDLAKISGAVHLFGVQPPNNG